MCDRPLPFRGAPPDRQSWVLKQAVPFNRERWKEKLKCWGREEAWPAELDRCPQGKRWPAVDRERVFNLASRATQPDQLLQAYIAVCVWGNGTNARGIERRIRPIARSDHVGSGDSPGDLLAAAVGALRDPGQGTLATYDDLRKGGRRNLPDLGPSFFTKFMYFTGFDHAGNGLASLIIDQNVANALNTLCCSGWPAGAWTVEQYRAYLEVAHRWAAEWQTRADVVERVLFEVGKANPDAIRALVGGPT